MNEECGKSRQEEWEQNISQQKLLISGDLPVINSLNSERDGELDQNILIQNTSSQDW